MHGKQPLFVLASLACITLCWPARNHKTVTSEGRVTVVVFRMGTQDSRAQGPALPGGGGLSPKCANVASRQPPQACVSGFLVADTVIT